MKLIAMLFISLIIFAGECRGAEYQPVENSPVFSSPKRKGSTASTGIRTTAPLRSASAPRTYVGKDGSALLFGTVEIGKALSTVPQWTDAISRNLKEPIFQPERYFNKSTTWKQLQDKASGQSPQKQLQLVNEFWNKWKYIDDRSNWHKDDYWENPAQFLQRSGDCEDYAIVKYFTLKELGFDPHAMRIVVLQNTMTGEAHAVLAVYLDGDVYILDNLSPIVMSHKRVTQYSPQFSVNEYQRWQHMRPMAKK